MVTFAARFVAPMGAVANNKASCPAAGNQGAGLVLFVTLLRQSMS